MIIGTICVHGVRALPVSVKPIPRGIIGAKVQFEYADPMWDGLSKTVVFRAGDVTKDVLNAGGLVKIPPEVITEVGEILKVGVYGEGIPTLWADLGRIRDATDPSGDETTDPSLPVWVQLQKQLDDLKENGSPGGGGSGEDGGYYTPSVKQPDNDTLQFNFAPSKANMPAIEPVEVTLPAGPQGNDYILTEADKKKIAEMAAELVEVPDSGGNVAYDEAQNLTDAQKAQARENIGAQPAGNYLTEVPDGYAKTEDVPTDAEIIQLIKDNAPESSGGGIAVTGAKAGQTVKISEVDENGVPTAWLPTDFPSGGGSGGKWELIAEGTVPEEVNRLDINKDINGNDFELVSWYLFATLEPCENNKINMVHVEVNEENTGMNVSADANSTRYYQSIGEIIGGYAAICAQSISNQDYNNTWNITNFTPKHSNFKGNNAKTISLYYGVGGNIAGANSTYVLYGVRA